jgi:hypothetical protein
MRRRHPVLSPDRIPAVGWSRMRLLALVVGVAGLSVMLICGLVLTVVSLTTDRRSRPVPAANPASSHHPSLARPSSAPSSDASLQRARDELADRPMPQPKSPVSNVYQPWKPAPLSLRDPGRPIVVPSPQSSDRLGVSTGFPQTPQGAIGQLTSIDQVALQSASLPGVRAVIGAWASEGGPSASSWSGAKLMASLLDTTGQSGTGSSSLSIVATPAMGVIKGRVGDDFTVVCVDFTVDVTVGTTTNSAGVADCQRMLWRDGRWMIGPGREPAEAVSVWPDTDAALETGFQDLELRRG